jgi:hypothetical protein
VGGSFGKLKKTYIWLVVGIRVRLGTLCVPLLVPILF